MKPLSRWHKIGISNLLAMGVWSSIAVVFEAVTHALVVVPLFIPGLGYFVMVWNDYLLVTIPSTGGLFFMAWHFYDEA